MICKPSTDSRFHDVGNTQGAIPGVVEGSFTAVLFSLNGLIAFFSQRNDIPASVSQPLLRLNAAEKKPQKTNHQIHDWQ